MSSNAIASGEAWAYGTTNVILGCVNVTRPPIHTSESLLSEKKSQPKKYIYDDNAAFCCDEIIRLNQDKYKILLNPLLMVSTLCFDFLKIKRKLLFLESEIKLYEEMVELYKWYYQNGYKF